MLGECLAKEAKNGEAVATLTEGVKIADRRGEMLPRNEMVEMLKSLGAAVPQLKTTSAPAQQAGEGQVLCRRCGKLAPRLASPPMRNDFGRLVFENTCTSCWREAIGMGTKVNNE
jgi:cytochrome c5